MNKLSYEKRVYYQMVILASGAYISDDSSISSDADFSVSFFKYCTMAFCQK